MKEDHQFDLIEYMKVIDGFVVFISKEKKGHHLKIILVVSYNF